MLLLIPAMLLVIWAQFKVKSTYAKYSQIPASSGKTGAEIAGNLLRDSGLTQIKLEETPGTLTDHYDPRAGILRLSKDIANSKSVAALGIAAHEVGHAIQHKEAYGTFMLRQNIVPLASIGSQLAIPLFVAGLIFALPWLMNVGILLFAGAVLFQMVTLPVELNASSRALSLLQTRGYLAGEEVGDAKKVLRAAAWTYVGALAVALTHFLRLLLLKRSRN